MTVSSKNYYKKSDSRVKSLFNVFDNICDLFNFELDETKDITPLVNVTKDVVLNEEMLNT